MKYRGDFVTNSSSTSYIVTFKGETRKDRSARAFAEDVVHCVYEFGEEYGPWGPQRYSQIADLKTPQERHKILTNEADKGSYLAKVLLMDEEEQIRIIAKELLQYIPRNTEQYSEHEICFGDEDGTLIGKVGDYMFRNGFISERFEINYHKSCR